MSDPDFSRILELRIDQVTRREAETLASVGEAFDAKRVCEKRLGVRLATQADRLPWRGQLGGQRVDRSRIREVRRVRRQMDDSVVAERDRLERELLPPDLRTPMP